MPRSTRRGFITGCSAAVAAFAGANFNTLAFGDPNTSVNEDILVTVFLRGGIDGLSLVFPMGGADRGHYEAARPSLKVPLTGSNAALRLSDRFGLHPAAGRPPSGSSPPATLFDLYRDGKLAMVVAAGMKEGNRSHFDSMAFMELGTPGELGTSTGWLTRHLQTADGLPPEIIMPALAVGNQSQQSLRGSREAVNMTSPDGFSLEVGPHQWRNAQRVALRNLFKGQSWLHDAGTETLDAVDIIELNSSDSVPPSNGAVYPNTSFGRHLRTIARMIKLDLGLRVATVDLGGWDTHNGQGNDGGGYFSSHVGELAQGLAAFYTDLDGSGAQAYSRRLTVVVQSEFGRRLRQNADAGTDHGHGNVMMVLSNHAVGGVHGTWPGLANDQLFQGADLEVTTDYRQVLSEILVGRLGSGAIDQVFPGFDFCSALGIVEGAAGATECVFRDSFESGDFGSWSRKQG